MGSRAVPCRAVCVCVCSCVRVCVCVCVCVSWLLPLFTASELSTTVCMLSTDNTLVVPCPPKCVKSLVYLVYAVVPLFTASELSTCVCCRVAHLAVAQGNRKGALTTEDRGIQEQHKRMSVHEAKPSQLSCPVRRVTLTLLHPCAVPPPARPRPSVLRSPPRARVARVKSLVLCHPSFLSCPNTHCAAPPLSLCFCFSGASCARRPRWRRPHGFSP